MGIKATFLFLRATGGPAATLGAGVKLLDEAAETWINRTRLGWVSGVNQLVTVVVHFYSAVRTRHLSFCLSHRGLQLF